MSNIPVGIDLAGFVLTLSAGTSQLVSGIFAKQIVEKEVLRFPSCHFADIIQHYFNCLLICLYLPSLREF